MEQPVHLRPKPELVRNLWLPPNSSVNLPMAEMLVACKNLSNLSTPSSHLKHLVRVDARFPGLLHLMLTSPASRLNWMEAGLQRTQSLINLTHLFIAASEEHSCFVRWKICRRFRTSLCLSILHSITEPEPLVHSPPRCISYNTSNCRWSSFTTKRKMFERACPLTLRRYLSLMRTRSIPACTRCPSTAFPKSKSPGKEMLEGAVLSGGMQKPC